MLRIALTTWTDVFNAGGMEGAILRIAKGLAKYYDIEVDIMMLLPEEQIPFQPDGLNGILSLPSPWERVNFYKIGNWTGGTLELHKWGDIHRSILELHSKRQYSLFHGFYASISGFIATYAAAELNLPSIISVRGCDVNRDVFNTGRFFHLKWAIENATRVTALSKELLHRSHVISPCLHKGKVIHNSINPENFDVGVYENSYSKPLLGSLGVFRNVKGLEVLLSAFQIFLAKYPTAQLLLIGDVKIDEKQHFNKLLQKYGVEARVALTGIIPQKEVLCYLRSLDMFLFTSVQDACPNVVLEAMLSEIPIVATRVGAVPDLIESGKHGILVSPGSSQDLYRAMDEIYTSQISSDMAKQAKDRVLTEFTLQKELAEYVDIYYQCFEPKSGINN